MKVNGETNGVRRQEFSRETGLIPPVISVRTGDFEPLLKKWRDDNQRVPWSCLLEDALKLVLKKYAGKRYAHLVAEEKGEVAA